MLTLTLTDVTKKAITHRLAKLRLMADEHIPYEGSASPSLPLPPHIKRGKPTNDAALAIIAGNYAHIYPSVATFDLVAAQTSAPALAIARSIHTPKVKKVITPKAKGKGSPLKNVVYSASDSESDTPMSDFEALSITKVSHCPGISPLQTLIGGY